MHVFLETERLILRRLTAEDANDLFALDDDPDVTRYINGGKPASREAIEHESLPRSLRFYERFRRIWSVGGGGEIQQGIFGTCNIGPIEGSGPEEVEMGYALHTSAWGKGYATEAVRALIHKGFADLGVGCVAGIRNGGQRPLSPGDGEGGPKVCADIAP